MKRLSPAFLTVAMLGVVGLLVALYVGKKLLARDVAMPSDPLVNLPMALTDLKPGTRLTEAHLGLGKARQSSLTRDTVQSNRVLVGRVVKSPIQAAQPISTYDLYPPGENAPLDMAPGMRAVSVPMASATAAAVGQYVDVHFTPSSDPNSDQTGGQILTLFKGVKILEMNGASSGSSSVRNGADVTLELTPEQANIILLAKDHGTLDLVYTPEGKGTGGVAVSDADRATLYEILGYKPQPAPEPPRPFTTELYSGAGLRTNQFVDGVRLGTDSPSSSPAAHDNTDGGSPAPSRRNNDFRPSTNPSSGRPAIRSAGLGG